MNTPNEDDTSIDITTAITNVEPSSTTSATSSLFPATVVGIGQVSRGGNVESLAAATARGNAEIIEDEDGPSDLPFIYSEWGDPGWTDSTAGWAALVDATFDATAAAAANDEAATANNEATVPEATVEAPNSPTAIATIMSDSSLAVALSSHPLGHANDMYDNNTVADVGMDMDAELDINNQADDTATGATLEPPATTTSIKADASEKGALFLIESVKKVAADLKEEEENAKDDIKR